MEIANLRLIQKLEEKQTELKLNHSRFAKLLNISHNTWSDVRLGKKSPGIQVLGGIVKYLPELTSEVVIFLGSSVGIS